MHSFSMRPAKYFYDKPLPKYLDPKTVLIYRPHPVEQAGSIHGEYPHHSPWQSLGKITNLPEEEM